MSKMCFGIAPFGKPGILVYGTLNPKVRKLVTMIYVKKVFRDRSND